MRAGVGQREGGGVSLCAPRSAARAVNHCLLHSRRSSGCSRRAAFVYRRMTESIVVGTQIWSVGDAEVGWGRSVEGAQTPRPQPDSTRARDRSCEQRRVWRCLSTPPGGRSSLESRGRRRSRPKRPCTEVRLCTLDSTLARSTHPSASAQSPSCTHQYETHPTRSRGQKNKTVGANKAARPTQMVAVVAG
jgi:hypothetical protein